MLIGNASKSCSRMSWRSGLCCLRDKIGRVKCVVMDGERGGGCASLAARHWTILVLISVSLPCVRIIKAICWVVCSSAGREVDVVVGAAALGHASHHEDLRGVGAQGDWGVTLMLRMPSCSCSRPSEDVATCLKQTACCYPAGRWPARPPRHRHHLSPCRRSVLQRRGTSGQS